MTVGELCNRAVAVGWRDETLVEAAKRMREHHVGDLVIVNGKLGDCVPVGILTDRDMVVEVIAEAPENLNALTVGDILTRDLVTAEERESVHTAMRRMQRVGVRRLPVVDEGGKLVGILSLDDILGFLADEMGLIGRMVERQIEIEVGERS